MSARLRRASAPAFRPPAPGSGADQLRADRCWPLRRGSRRSRRSARRSSAPAPAASPPAGCWAAALPSRTALRSPLEQRRGDRLAPRRSLRPAAGAATPLAGGDRGGDRRPAPATHALGAAVMLARHRHQPVVAQRMNAHHLARPSRRLANALREQRVVLAQERADDERRAAASTATRSSGRASGIAPRPASRSLRGAGGSRCSRCRGRAPAWPSRCSSSTRAVRRCQRADALRAVLGLDLRQAARHVVERRRSSRPSSTRRPA